MKSAGPSHIFWWEAVGPNNTSSSSDQFWILYAFIEIQIVVFVNKGMYIYVMTNNNICSQYDNMFDFMGANAAVTAFILPRNSCWSRSSVVPVESLASMACRHEDRIPSASVAVDLLQQGLVA